MLFSHVLCLTAAVSLPNYALHGVMLSWGVYEKEYFETVWMHYTTDFRNSVLQETWDLRVIQDFELPKSQLTLTKKGLKEFL